MVVVGVDDSDHSYRALEWAVRHVAATQGAELVVVHGKPSASSVVSFGSPGAGRKPLLILACVPFSWFNNSTDSIGISFQLPPGTW